MRQVYYLREGDWNFYLIPEDLVKEFDMDWQIIDDASMLDHDEENAQLFEELDLEFRQTYGKYEVEDLHNVRLYIDE